ncbi:MAG: LysR family transcriptional regulator [Lachnospiraceae bacterium]|jgi:DNA-binding transcriptional LysR family regulator|nr:LysR family transcriptional regulator [Lachnospiraceae bacterium]
MNLNQLEYFITAAETLNFTKAAEMCFITQTAISQQIKALEENIGVQLFDRSSKHHIRLTAAGEVYLREARDIVRRSNDAARLARSTSEGVSGSICIGFISGLVNKNLSDIIRTYHITYPNVKIRFYRDNMSGLYQALDKGECDIIFNLTSTIGNSRPSDGHRYFQSFPLVAALPGGHRLCERSTISYSELEHENFIIMQPSDRPKDEAEEVLVTYERGGFIPNVVATEGDPETLLLMVASGIGISVLPEYIVSNLTLGRNINIVHITKPDGSPEMLDIEVCWSKSGLNPATERFFSNLEQYHTNEE